MAARPARSSDTSAQQLQWIAERVMSLIEKNTAALERNTSSSDALKNQVGEQISASIETNRLLDKHPAVFESIIEKLNDGGSRTQKAVDEVNAHATLVVEGAVVKLRWFLAACVILIVLGSLFDGAGTKYLQMLHLLTP